MDRTLIESYKISHFIKFKDKTGAEKYIQATELNTAEFERESNDYEPEWIDYKTAPTYSTGSKDTLSLEISLLAPGGIQAELYAREDDLNVPVEYVRTIAYDYAAGKPCEDTALVAKHASAILNVSPITTEAGEPGVISATVSISSDYDYGTFNAVELTYTPADSTTGGTTGGTEGTE